MKTLDAACRRILEAKYKLGLFDDPYKYCDLSRPARDIFTREHRDAARRIAAESFVLLKNEPFEGQGKKSSRPVLPLEKQGTVAVIGPLGNTRSNMPGTWSVAARLDDYPSLYEGLKEMTAGRVNITYAKGSNLIGDVAYEERATLFGRSLSRDNRTDKELLDDVLVENKQAIEMTQIYRDIISGTRELMTTIINNRLNNAMKFLAAITIVMAVPTVISGVYGMNVGTKWMPFANVPYGFEIVCGIILVISIVIAIILKKKKMLKQ